MLRYNTPNMKGYQLEIPNAKVKRITDLLTERIEKQIYGFSKMESLPEGEAMWECQELCNISDNVCKYIIISDILHAYAEVTM